MEPKYISFATSLCPSVNHAYINLRSGKRILTKQAKEFKQEVARIIESQGNPKFSSPVKLTIEYYAKNNRVRDLDNFAKIIQDSLTSAKAIEDDDCKHITELNIKYKGVDVTGKGYLIISLTAQENNHE